MKPVKIDLDMLAIRCRMERSEFNHPDYGEYVPLIRRGYTSYSTVYDPKTKTTTRTPKQVDDEETFYIYQDNGASVLAVAHLDTVVSTFSNWTFEKAVLGGNRRKETCIFNAQLDDRLGAYILLDLLPQFLGEGAYDILLTNDEEVSASTAEDFITPEGKSYNWIFQFDRRGTGAVLYDYEDTFWRTTVEEFFTVHQGSFSDICKLYDLGVKGINVGTGYHDEHQDWCYMVLEEVEEQVEAFVRFFKRHKDTKFPHDRTVVKNSWNRWQGGWDDDDEYGVFRTGSYWNGTRWVTPSGATGTAAIPDPKALPDHTGGTSVTGAPKGSGIKRIHAQPLTDENLYDEDTREFTFEDRDFISNTELELLRAATARLTDKDYESLNPQFLKSVQYFSDDPMDWMELPAVQKINTLYQINPQYPPTLVSVYHNRVSDARCVECKGCSMAVPVQDVYWTDDCVPICVDCISTIPQGSTIITAEPPILNEEEMVAWEVPLTDSQVQWLKEGGGVRKSTRGAIRSFVGVDSKTERCYCSVCGAPEWKDKMMTFSNPLFKSEDQADVCRDCFDQYQV